MSGYVDRAGIDSRANSALLAVESIITDYAVPAAVRLALVAERMAQEPILTDTSPAAFTVRSLAGIPHPPMPELAGTRHGKASCTGDHAGGNCSGYRIN